LKYASGEKDESGVFDFFDKLGAGYNNPALKFHRLSLNKISRQRREYGCKRSLVKGACSFFIFAVISIGDDGRGGSYAGK
jgi:hypothetical protein